MSSKKVFIETHGCQMNVDDSIRMGRSLAPLSYEITQNPQEADLILINTCSVREKASHKARSSIGSYYEIKSQNPKVLLGLTGCQAQAEGKKLLQRFQYLDFVLGPDQMGSLPDKVKELEQGRAHSINGTQRIKPEDFSFVNLKLEAEESWNSAYVTIMKGCDNFCSFCIVPYVRGREVSRSSDEIISEIQNLCSHGVKEVTLLGQNVNSYGTKNCGEISFTGLLYRIAGETPVQRIRFMTSHPKDVGEDLAKAFGEIPALAKHLHLPIQSGSNAVLKKMYRTYSREEYLKIIQSLRNACPELAITTDFIVGFPGETDSDFEETLSLIKEVEFDGAYSFQYSPRPHTTAGRYFEDDVSRPLKEERLQKLQECLTEMTLKKNEKCVGRIYEVLLEGFSKWGETLQGRSTQNRIVHLNSTGNSEVGEMVQVKILRATHNSLLGEIMGEMK